MADTATELVKRLLDVVQALRCAVPDRRPSDGE